LKARDPQALADWYAAHRASSPRVEGRWFLTGGVGRDDRFRSFSAGHACFGEVRQEMMVNFRVDDLDGLVAQLADAGVRAGVRIDPKRENTDYGRLRGFGIWRATGWNCGRRQRRSEMIFSSLQSFGSADF